MKLTRKILESLVEEELKEQKPKRRVRKAIPLDQMRKYNKETEKYEGPTYKELTADDEEVGPPQLGGPYKGPEEPWFTDPEVDGAVRTPQEDGHMPRWTPRGPIFKSDVYSNPKYKEYFERMRRRELTPPPRTPKLPGLKDRRTDPRSPEYVPGYHRSRPPMAESKLTKSKLKQLIKEELQTILSEGVPLAATRKAVDHVGAPKQKMQKYINDAYTSVDPLWKRNPRVAKSISAVLDYITQVYQEVLDVEDKVVNRLSVHAKEKKQ